MDYKGYKFIDTIMLVCKDKKESSESWGGWGASVDYYQAYLVDPANKKQLEAARHWASYTEYGPGNWNDEGKFVREWELKHEPVEFTFENKDFTLELLDCAGGSSQGGKLSFWNCIVTKDGNRFKIGINSDMLLDLLKNAVFDKGLCKSPLVFITQKGKVGMTVVGSDAYNNCIKDKELKDTVKAKATTKYNFGDKINTATLDEIYFGKLTKYYSFDLGEQSGWGYGRYFDARRCTLTRLKEPIEYHLIDSDTYYVKYNKQKYEKLSEVAEHYNNYFYNAPILVEKKPKRAVSGSIELDITEEDFYKQLLVKAYDVDSYMTQKKDEYHSRYTEDKYYNEKKTELFCRFLDSKLFGLGTEPFELSEEILKLCKEYGIKIVEE
jgi:hypothetical protein